MKQIRPINLFQDALKTLEDDVYLSDSNSFSYAKNLTDDIDVMTGKLLTYMSLGSKLHESHKYGDPKCVGKDNNPPYACAICVDQVLGIDLKV